MRSRRWPAVLGVAVGLVVIVVGTVGLLSRHPGTAPLLPPPDKATAATPAHSLVTGRVSPSASPSPTGVGAGVLKTSYAVSPGQEGVPVALPVSLTIPAINVKNAPVIQLGLTNAAEAAQSVDNLKVGELYTAPLDKVPWEAGWYKDSSRPGEIGPAIIAGHINYGQYEGVFEHLTDMRPGELIEVGLADGSTVEFRVTNKQTTLKTDFPVGGVYGRTADPELRLITCGGDFDDTPGTSGYGHYYSNTIIYATEVS